METNEPRVVNILLVEDDDVDVMGIKRAFKKSNVTNPIYRAKDGIEALEILKGANGHQPLLRPFLILLDINMPRMNGFELLKEIRDDLNQKTALVFILTTSKQEEDIVRAYGYNVAGYITKSDFNNGFLKVIEMINLFQQVVEFP